MRRSKGYTDELEKLNRDDSGLAIVVKLKEAAAKKIQPQNYWFFSRRVLVCIFKQGVHNVIQKLQHFKSRQIIINKNNWFKEMENYFIKTHYEKEKRINYYNALKINYENEQLKNYYNELKNYYQEMLNSTKRYNEYKKTIKYI